MWMTAQPWPNEAAGWACAFVCESGRVQRLSGLEYAAAFKTLLLFSKHDERCLEGASARASVSDELQPSVSQLGCLRAQPCLAEQGQRSHCTQPCLGVTRKPPFKHLSDIGVTTELWDRVSRTKRPVATTFHSEAPCTASSHHQHLSAGVPGTVPDVQSAASDMERVLAAVAAEAGLAAGLDSPEVYTELAAALGSVFSAPALALLLRLPGAERKDELARLGRLMLGALKYNSFTRTDREGRSRSGDVRRLATGAARSAEGPGGLPCARQSRLAAHASPLLCSGAQVGRAATYALYACERIALVGAASATCAVRRIASRLLRPSSSCIRWQTPSTCSLRCQQVQLLS